LTRRQEVSSPVLNAFQGNIEARADASSFVQATKQVDNNLATTVIVNDFELTNVSVESFIEMDSGFKFESIKKKPPYPYP